MTSRLIVLTACFVLTAAYVTHALQPERVPLREPLVTMPRQLDGWTGRDTAPLTKDVLDVLGVDEYLSRYYTASPTELVSLYVGYYQTQRQGDTIHSPMNCLPGAGWLPMSTTRTDIVVPGRSAPITVNQVMIQKGLDRQVVLYWYQSHGRVVASEYWSKIYMVTDAVRLNRSEAALVRVVSPVLNTDNGLLAAEQRATRFVQALFPRLERHLPS